MDAELCWGWGWAAGIHISNQKHKCNVQHSSPGLLSGGPSYGGVGGNLIYDILCFFMHLPGEDKRTLFLFRKELKRCENACIMPGDNWWEFLDYKGISEGKGSVNIRFSAIFPSVFPMCGILFLCRCSEHTARSQ